MRVRTESAPRPGRLAVLAALCLVLLLAHTWLYRFLTDDAFISFRYARNLAHGHGLVFNPGHERVEGYTNFLWVLVLALFDVVGLRPELAAYALGFALTAVLFLLVFRYVARDPPPRGQEWIAVAPLLLLACTRSVAVWGTSGLETRLFEVLVLAGALRLVDETARLAGGGAARPLAALLFALSALTRPEGALVGACALGATLAYLLWTRGMVRARGLLPSLALFGLVVAAHFLFRRSYYGEWLPNTYYAKVGGRAWWSMGSLYLGTLALEYGAPLGLPLVFAGVRRFIVEKKSHVPLIFAAVIVPHALFVASVGGDHFEYRAVDVYFPFVLLLVHDGARALARGFRSTLAVAVLLLAVLFATVSIPTRSHLYFPSEYWPGYPNSAPAGDRRADYLNPDGLSLFDLPVLREIDAMHRRAMVRLSSHFIALRQEEHRYCLDALSKQTGPIVRAIARGDLPKDTYVAIDCVGLIPYATDLRTLDRRGLTDRVVARYGTRDPARFMAHEFFADPAYARARGVDVWSFHASNLVWDVLDPEFQPFVGYISSTGQTCYCIELEPGFVMYGWLPGGIERAQERFPRLRFLLAENDAPFLRMVAEARRRASARAKGLIPGGE